MDKKLPSHLLQEGHRDYTSVIFRFLTVSMTTTQFTVLLTSLFFFLKKKVIKKKVGTENVTKAFSPHVCSIVLIGFEDLKVFSFCPPFFSFFPFLFSFLLFLCLASNLHLLLEQSSVC